MKKITFTIVLILATLFLQAQIVNPVKWDFFSKQNGDEITLVFTAAIEKGWHLYDTDLPEGGPVATQFAYKDSTLFDFVGSLQKNPDPEMHFDQTFQMQLGYFAEEVTFTQKIKLKASGLVGIKGTVTFMSCNEETCTPPDEQEFLFQVKGTKKEGEASAVVGAEKKGRNYWNIFLLSFLAGFAALLTPCVFPMIPMTVSFFTKQSKTKAKGIRNGLLYGISIILIYVILGTVVTAIFGAESLNKLSTNPWFNLFFALLLFTFAFSFMGAFEIVLPSNWVNAVDRKADKGGFIGIFFMAFALALVSFSCTGPIVGALIVEAARSGGLAPVVGMLGFSLALAIPFTLFAAFPGWLNSLPKSGGWLNSVKVVLGFLEFAFAFKFLSIADMVLNLHILEREVYIAIWIAIAVALALYLWGKIRFPHDSPLTHLPVSRFVFGTIVLAFAIYMLPGLWGAPVKLISGFPPPADYAESPLGVGRTQAPGFVAATRVSGTEVLGRHTGPHGIPLFDDYEEALAFAKKTGKPLLVDFTGKGCTNCRKMEDNVWVNQEVKNMLLNDFVVVSLYVDLRTKLPKAEQYVSKVTGRKVKTIGNKWTDLQISRYNRNTQPYYVILNHNEQQLGKGYSYNASPEEFVVWLKSSLHKFE